VNILMNYITIIFVAFALSMDAFAVSLCFGTCQKNKNPLAVKAGIYFGIFQAVMPLLGWGIGYFLKEIIQQMDHWIVFGLLTLIGAKMVFEAIKNKGVSKSFNTGNFWVMTSLAFATSIDAFAVGLSFALLQIPILIAVTIIGIVTFGMSYTGVHLGRKLSKKIGNKAEIIGGIVLIGIGLKVLIEHIYNNL